MNCAKKRKVAYAKISINTMTILHFRNHNFIFLKENEASAFLSLLIYLISFSNIKIYIKKDNIYGKWKSYRIKNEKVFCVMDFFYSEFFFKFSL